MNIVPCTAWVKRGVAAAVPEQVTVSPSELQRIIELTQPKFDDADDSDEDCKDAAPKKKEKTSMDIPKADEFDLDNYDEEPDNTYQNINNGEEAKDSLITRDIVDSEEEDDIIKKDDNLVLIGHVEKDASTLEVYVYNEKEGSFYCHHDMLLPSFPLCLEWLDYDPTNPKPGNLCAIGNMDPIIEVWDIDLINCLEPSYRLGRKPSKKKNQKRIGHRDAVLDLAWNANYGHVLASGSVDQTVLLWDLENGTPVNKMDVFSEKVQSIKWHPTETHRLLTGCADKHVRLFDCKEEAIAKSWEVSGEVEAVLWNHFDPNYCLASTDNGHIVYMDVRNDEPVWQVSAHEKEVSGLALSSSCSGLLLSASNDSVIKIWDIVNNEPSLVWEMKTNLGALLCLASNPNNAFVFSVGGDNKSHNFKVLDVTTLSEVRSRFEGRGRSGAIAPAVKEEEMMEVTDDMDSMLLNQARLEKTVKKSKRKGNAS